MTDSLPGLGPQPSVTPGFPAKQNQDSGRFLTASLDKDVAFYRSHTFAPSTSQTYLAQKSAYFEFCDKMSIQPVPLSQQDLGRYIAYLSRRLCFTSVRQYLNVFRLLHIESGFANPLVCLINSEGCSTGKRGYSQSKAPQNPGYFV